MALGRLARARALLQGRDHVLPEDIQFGLVPVFAHRIVLQEGQGVGLATRLLEDLRQRVRVPV
jgi:MoxR-like ATPase